MKMHARFALCLAVALAMHATGTASAQRTDDERARAHFLAGNSYFEQARYREAHDQFLEAYELSHRVELLLNASKAAERNLDFVEAVRLVDLFLEVAPPDHPMRSVEVARREGLVELRDRQAAMAPPVPETPPPPPDTPPPPVVEEPGGLGTTGWIGVGTAGGGLAIGIVGLATGLVANNTYNDLDGECPGGVCPFGTGAEGRISSGRRMARVSTATTFVGGAALIAGVVLIIVDDGPTEEGGRASLTPMVAPGPGDVGLSLGWSF